jgi:hypothetical protein
MGGINYRSLRLWFTRTTKSSLRNLRRRGVKVTVLKTEFNFIVTWFCTALKPTNIEAVVKQFGPSTKYRGDCWWANVCQNSGYQAFKNLPQTLLLSQTAFGPRKNENQTQFWISTQVVRFDEITTVYKAIGARAFRFCWRTRQVNVRYLVTHIGFEYRNGVYASEGLSVEKLTAPKRIR